MLKKSVTRMRIINKKGKGGNTIKRNMIEV
jgi:hypothetical protein